MTLRAINPTEGHTIAGVVIDSHSFFGRVRGDQLLQMTVDPRRTESKRRAKGQEDDPQVADLRELRKAVQRMFEGAKARNVAPYARYICEVHNGRAGMTPPIILFTSERLPVAETEEKAQLLVPWGTLLVAIDGETQLAARFEAARLDPKTRSERIPVLIVHSQPLEWARQVFHDLNLLGVRPNPAVGLSMDSHDSLTSIARLVEREVPLFRGAVSGGRRQLRPSDPELMTLPTLRTAVACFVLGIRGVGLGTKPHVMDPEVQDAEAERAVEWFTALSESFRSEFTDRSRFILTTPPVLAALGAVGHEIPDTEDDQGERRRNALLALLHEIDWSRADHWEGVAGKKTASGRIVIGGSKEVAHAVFAAMLDKESPGYAKVRVGGGAKPARKRKADEASDAA